MKLAAVFLVLLITMFYLITVAECNDLGKFFKNLEKETKKLGDQIEKEGKNLEKELSNLGREIERGGKNLEKDLKNGIKDVENQINKEKERYIEKEKQKFIKKEKQKLIDELNQKLEMEKMKLEEFGKNNQKYDVEQFINKLKQKEITDISIEDIQTAQEILGQIDITESIGKSEKGDLEINLEHKEQRDLIQLSQPYPVKPDENFIFLYQDLVTQNANSTDYIELVSEEFESESLRYTVSEDGISGVALSEGIYEVNITLKVYPPQMSPEFETCYGILKLQVGDITELKSDKSENATIEPGYIKISWFELICFGIIAMLFFPSLYVAYKIISKCYKQKRKQRLIDIKHKKVEQLEDMYRVTDSTTDDEFEEELQAFNGVV